MPSPRSTSTAARRGALMLALQTMGLVLTAPRSQTAPAHARPAATPAVPAYLQATTELRARRYAAAYGQLARLADGGHEAAAAMALLMHREGALLFDGHWYASPDQRRRWGLLAAHWARQPIVGLTDEGDA